jgi:hypothetical protein
LGHAAVVSCVVRGSGGIVITCIIVVTGVIVSWNGVVAFSVDEAYFATVVEDRTAITKLRRLERCMIRINIIQKLRPRIDRAIIARISLVGCKDRQVRIRGDELGKDVVLTFLEVCPDLYPKSMVGRLLELLP